MKKSYLPFFIFFFLGTILCIAGLAQTKPRYRLTDSMYVKLKKTYGLDDTQIAKEFHLSPIQLQTLKSGKPIDVVFESQQSFNKVRQKFDIRMKTVPRNPPPPPPPIQDPKRKKVVSVPSH